MANLMNDSDEQRFIDRIKCIAFREAQCRNQDFWVGGAKNLFFVTNEFNCIKIDNNAITMIFCARIVLLIHLTNLNISSLDCNVCLESKCKNYKRLNCLTIGI